MTKVEDYLRDTQSKRWIDKNYSRSKKREDKEDQSFG